MIERSLWVFCGPTIVAVFHRCVPQVSRTRPRPHPAQAVRCVVILQFGRFRATSGFALRLGVTSHHRATYAARRHRDHPLQRSLPYQAVPNVQLQKEMREESDRLRGQRGNGEVYRDSTDGCRAAAWLAPLALSFHRGLGAGRRA